MKNKKIFTLKELTDNLKQIQAKDIMTKEVITVTKDDTLDEVAELMINKRISGFPVIEDGEKLSEPLLRMIFLWLWI